MPVSTGQALEAARDRLVGISQYPRRDAEGLLIHVLGWDQTALLTHPERLLTSEECSQYEALLERRAAHEPMQYILGSQEFFGLMFEVSPAVLIPRPETEHVVEAALEHLSRIDEPQIVDVGTGSGAIAVALAHTLPGAHVTAVDLSLAALDVTRRNAQRHEVGDRVRLVQSDLLASLQGDVFDLVVSNPPYVAAGEVLEPQVFDYEPRSALYAGPTGLEIYQRLIPQAHQALKAGGWLILEIGFGQQAALEALLSGWSAVSSANDLQGIARVISARKVSSSTLSPLET